MFTRTLSILLVAALAMVLTPPATAVPVTVQYADATTCDPLGNGTDVHELGLGISGGGAVLFPINERISATAKTTNDSACPAEDAPAVVNTEVTMENLSGVDWAQVWYVADPAVTGLSNVDGTVNAGQAFRIDSVGDNKPLINEDIASNGIFEAGEIWTFIIDDYTSTFGTAADFLSVGRVGSLSDVEPFFSTGSIIAVRVPEPASLFLLLLGTSCASLIIRIRLG